MTEKELVSDNIKQLISFQLLDEMYAINIRLVQEIIRIQEITDIPRKEKYLLGVINLRGQIIPVIDLKLKLHLQKTEATNKSRIIVVKYHGVEVGMIVDAVLEVLRIPETEIEPPSPFISPLNTDHIKGLSKVAGKMVVILDVEKSLANETIKQEEQA